MSEVKKRRRGRYAVYKAFKHFKQEKDVRSMDEICISRDDEFRLQVQQEFLKEFFNVNYDDLKFFLFYHNIGSGKTCTAITVAEEFLKKNPDNRVTIILPARLRTNFLDELISPCAFNKYISQSDFVKYKSSDTSAEDKYAIEHDFMTKIRKAYDIMSYEKFNRMMQDVKGNIKEFIKEFTKNNMIIIDEVHNLFSTSYDITVYNKIFSDGILIPKTRGLNVILLNLLSQYCDDSCKIFFLTATPIFNNLSQLRELVKIMTPEELIPEKCSLRQLIEYSRGKVSYFPGVSMNAYPTVEYIYHEIPLNAKQDIEIQSITSRSSSRMSSASTVVSAVSNENSDSFLLKQRLKELCLLDINEINIGNLEENAPKIKLLVDNLESNVGKQIVFTNFVQKTLKIIEKILKEQGWFNILDVHRFMNDETQWDLYKSRVYAIWSGDTNDEEKTLIKNIMNSKRNLFGEYIKVVLGSPSIKEGVSFYHVQDMHIIDPIWNMSAKNQVEGRVIRYCSHADIDEKLHVPLKRHVKINYYKCIHNPHGVVEQTADERIYDEIIPDKYKLVRTGENALKHVAVDYHLFKNMYKKQRSASPTSPFSEKSILYYTDDDDATLSRRNAKDKCPKKNQPINGKCREGWEVKVNIHGIPCCEKIKQEKKNTSCPIDRQPVDGKCRPGYELRDNIHGVPCCYKIPRSRLQTLGSLPVIDDTKPLSPVLSLTAKKSPIQEDPLETTDTILHNTPIRRSRRIMSSSKSKK